MENTENGVQPILSHAEPVLTVKDVTETVLYWQNVLGFPAKWTWGDPPNHGGVSWGGVFVQFSQNPKLASAPQHNSVWIRVKHLEALYDLHQKKNADIVAPLENQPWGMAQYTVREMNGYFLHFAGPAINSDPRGQGTPAKTINILKRPPVTKEFRDLASSVGWSPPQDDATAEKLLAAAVFAVVAEDTTSGEIVGCALLLGDDVSFYYVKDVIVHPNWQRKGVGTRLMRALTNWLETNAPNKALVALITREGLEPFYRQFGFAPAFSMLRWITRG